MPKLMILKGDEPQVGWNIPEDRFVFLFTKKGVYHVDLSNGEMYLASPQLIEFGEGHKEIIREELKSEELVS